MVTTEDPWQEKTPYEDSGDDHADDKMMIVMMSQTGDTVTTSEAELHNRGPSPKSTGQWSSSPLIAINCGNIPVFRQTCQDGGKSTSHGFYPRGLNEIKPYKNLHGFPHGLDLFQYNIVYIYVCVCLCVDSLDLRRNPPDPYPVPCPAPERRLHHGGRIKGRVG